MSFMDKSDMDLDKLHEECGVFGIYSPEDEQAAHTIYYGLSALQHRGQEAAGMAVCNTGGPMWNVSQHKGMGLVNEVFHNDNLDKLIGNLGVGHVRYSTTGESSIENAQPLVLNYFKVDIPEYLEDVKLQIKDVNYHKDCYINELTSISETYNYMISKNITGVPVVDNSGKVIQLFDLDMEGKIASAAASTATEGSNYYLKSSIYNTPTEKAYMFEAPWMGNVNEDAKMRIDYFLNGTARIYK